MPDITRRERLALLAVFGAALSLYGLVLAASTWLVASGAVITLVACVVYWTLPDADR